MNPIMTQRPPESSRTARAGALLVALALGAGVIFVLSRLGLGETPSSRSVTVENPSPYIINVAVTGAERDGWIDFGSVRRENRETFEQTPDPGDEWVFRFSYAGVDAGELVVSRDQLAQDGWKITVPPESTEQLRQAGVPESVR